MNLQVTLAGYTPALWDVIPVISVSGGSADLVQYNGSSALQGLGGITFNGQSVAWGSPFGVGMLNPQTHTYPDYFTAYPYNPLNPSQAGVYLEVTGITRTQVNSAWTGSGGTNTSWGTTANWTSAGVPGSTTPAPFDTADFPAGLAVSATTTVTLDGTAGTLSAITINDGAGTIEPYSISQGTSGGSLTLSTTAGGVAQIVVSGGTNNSISANLVLATSAAVFTNPGTSLALSGSSITGSGPLIVTGSGTLVLAGSGTISSSTNVPSSTLEVDGEWSTSTLNVTGSQTNIQGSGQLAGSGTIALTNDNLYYNSTARSLFAGALTSSRTACGLEVDGGVLILSGSDSYLGLTNVAAGELITTSTGALPPHANLLVGPGSTLLYDPSKGAGPLGLASGREAAAVPEPGTLALLLAGLAAGTGASWRRKRAT